MSAPPGRDLFGAECLPRRGEVFGAGCLSHQSLRLDVLRRQLRAVDAVVDDAHGFGFGVDADDAVGGEVVAGAVAALGWRALPAVLGAEGFVERVGAEA